VESIKRLQSLEKNCLQCGKRKHPWPTPCGYLIFLCHLCNIQHRWPVFRRQRNWDKPFVKNAAHWSVQHLNNNCYTCKYFPLLLQLEIVIYNMWPPQLYTCKQSLCHSSHCLSTNTDRRTQGLWRGKTSSILYNNR